MAEPFKVSKYSNCSCLLVTEYNSKNIATEASRVNPTCCRLESLFGRQVTIDIHDLPWFQYETNRLVAVTDFARAAGF